MFRIVAVMVAATGCGLAVGTAAGCGPPDFTPLFPADYAATYTEVRNCRGPSGDHDLHNIRVLAAPDAVTPYAMRAEPFPVGALVIKEEHDFDDATCTNAILWWTVMEKLPVGSSPDTLDWRWQKVDITRKVITQDEPRCIGCHLKCGVPPDGYDGTCTVAP